MARPGSNHRIPLDLWLTKVEKLVAEESGFSLARYVDRDEMGQPVYDTRGTKEILADAKANTPGNYVILTDEGATCAGECTIGMNGTRQTPERFSAERAQTSLILANSESWERQCNAAIRNNERLEKKCEKLEAKLEAKDAVIAQLKEDLFDAVKADDNDRWEKLADKAMRLFDANQMQSRIVKVLGSPEVYGRLSERARNEVLALINGGSIGEAVETLYVAEDKEEADEEEEAVQ